MNKQAGYDNIGVIAGDGSLGLPEKAPFHGIIVTACAPHAPKRLLDQLEIGGRLILLWGILIIWYYPNDKAGKGGVEDRNILECAFVPFIGEEGWNGACPGIERGFQKPFLADKEDIAMYLCG